MVGPFQNVEVASRIWDKAAHFLAFGVVVICLAALLPQRNRTAIAVGSIVLGGLVELVQGVTGRDASWGDLLADALGVAAATVLWSAVRHFGPRTARVSRARPALEPQDAEPPHVHR